MTLIDDLGSQGGHGREDEVLRLSRIDFDRFGDLVKMVASALGGELEAVGDPGKLNKSDCNESNEKLIRI